MILKSSYVGRDQVREMCGNSADKQTQNKTPKNILEDPTKQTAPQQQKHPQTPAPKIVYIMVFTF